MSLVEPSVVQNYMPSIVAVKAVVIIGALFDPYNLYSIICQDISPSCPN